MTTPPPEKRLVYRGKIRTQIGMKKAEPNEQREIPTLGSSFANTAHMRRFTQPETEHQARHDHFLRDSSGLVLEGGERTQTPPLFPTHEMARHTPHTATPRVSLVQFSSPDVGLQITTSVIISPAAEPTATSTTSTSVSTTTSTARPPLYCCCCCYREYDHRDYAEEYAWVIPRPSLILELIPATRSSSDGSS